jgi:hypothetical protein
VASFPEDGKEAIGYALYIAQQGGKHPDSKPLRGFGSAGVRVCLARLPEKIEEGNQDPRSENELIKLRLKRAGEEHARWLSAHTE